MLCFVYAASIFSDSGMQLLWLETCSVYSHKLVTFPFYSIFSVACLSFLPFFQYFLYLVAGVPGSLFPKGLKELCFSATSYLLNLVHIRPWSYIQPKHEFRSISFELPFSHLHPPFCLCSVVLLSPRFWFIDHMYI